MAAAAERAPPTCSAGEFGGGDGGCTHDVFLSYSHDAKADVAQPLAEGLQKKGVSVWWDHAAVEIGDSLPQKIREGLEGARYGVVIVSRGYLDSGWGRTEQGVMFGRGLTVFPILHGVSVEDAKKSFPAISETLMREWEDPPTSILREIADRINSDRVGKKPAGTAGIPDGKGWKAQLDKSSRGSVMATPRAIAGKTIPRTAEALGIERLLDEHGRVVVIGDRGSGKSALMCQVYERLKESTATVLVKGDDFLGAESFDDLDKSIVPGHSFVRLVERAASSGGGGAVVIIDSLDAIARDKRAMAAFKLLVKGVWGAGAKTIVTVRSYDYQYSDLIASTDWGAEYHLDALSASQVSKVLGRLGIASEPPAGLAPLLATPLNLYLLSRVAGPGGGGSDLAQIRHEIDLYDAHWHRHVEQDSMPGRVRDALYGAARNMVSTGRMSVPRSLLDRDAEAADVALSAGVLRPVPATGRVRFFHHAYLDYALSRAVLDDRAGVVGLVRSDEYNMFVRPTLPLTFAMAHKRGPREFAGLAAEMLGSGLKHYWKMTAASALARIRGGPPGDYGRVGRLLTEKSMLQRHFLAEAAEQKNAFWLGAWGGSFLKEWAMDGGNPNGHFLAGYARAAASADPALHALAFALLRSIAENNQSGAARQRAVTLMAGIDAPGRAAWLERASESADVRVRDGVARILPDLLSTDPGSVPRAFASLFAYEETSGRRTALADIGSTRITSNAVQDNAMVKWRLEKEFPGMLRERPDVMIKAASGAVERAYAGASDPLPDDGSLADAGPGALLHALMPRQPSNVVIPAVRAYLEACDDDEFGRLAPLLTDSRLGSFRSMLIDGMARRGADYLARLVDELADPCAYEHRLMQESARKAIGRVAGLLSGGQASRILCAIMRSNRPEDLLESARQYEVRLRAQLQDSIFGEASSPEEEDYVQAALGLRASPEDMATHAETQSLRARAQFLAEFPEGMLGDDHLEIVRNHLRPPAAAPPLDFSFQEMPAPEAAERSRAESVAGVAPGPPPAAPPSTAERSREESILAAIGEARDREGKIALLESISEHLDDPGDDPLPRIEEFLLECAGDPDPDPGAAGEPAKSAVDYPTVRGLAALCLAKMVALRGGREAEGALRALSKDPSNVVRGGVARGLAHLLPRRYDLAYPILLEYSRDPDAHVRLFLGDRFDVVLNKGPAQASTVVENVLATGGPPMLGTVDSLLWLALKKGDPRADSLLDKVVDGGAPLDIRAEIPFALKPYLSSPAHQDAALGLLLRLLKAGPDDVRSKAAFFTFNGIEGGSKAAAGPDYARKIRQHLDLLASLFGRGRLDLQTAEHTAQFLEEHWGEAPDAALSCLEAIARGGPGLAHQPVLAQCTASIVSGMIERYMPGDDEWRRCLDVLDVYAAAGWPEVLSLLAAMERPD